MITIDGAAGEGGGQILRSALALSTVTGQAFRIHNIRKNRPRPGLLRQHLTCVAAAKQVSGGHAEGADIGSDRLTFTPGEPRAGGYDFAIGTAGGTGLVLQTVLPALLTCDAPSEVALKGGTHNPQAPSFEVIAEAFLPALAQAGIVAETELASRGFYPAGGGAWRARILPSPLDRPIDATDRGKLQEIGVEAMVSNLGAEIAQKELAIVKRRLALDDGQLHLRHYDSPGPGNAVLVRLDFEAVQERFITFGTIGRPAEKVGEHLAQSVQRYLKSGAAIGPFLADQLLVPMAIGAGGRFTTMGPTRHFVTNCAVIRRFMDVEIHYDEITDRSAGGAAWLVTIGR